MRTETVIAALLLVFVFVVLRAAFLALRPTREQRDWADDLKERSRRPVSRWWRKENGEDR